MILAHGNQSAPLALRTFVAQRLAYTGMMQTSYWKTLSDTCKMKGVSLWAGRFDYPSNTLITPAGCGSHTSAFKDSLQMLLLCQ